MAHAKDRIRVSFVCFNAYKLFNPKSAAQLGGTELQIHALATTLSNHALFNVSCIVGDFGQSRIEHRKKITIISAFRLDKKIANLILAPILFFRALRTAKPDIVISSPAGPEIGLLALYCFVYNAKYIFRTASDVDCNLKKERVLDPLSRFLYRIGIRYAHRIVVQHERQKNDMQSFYSRQSSIISNGYDIPAHTITLAARTNTIVWIGSSRLVKRADIFFSLVREFPQYQFDMILSKSGDRRLYETYKQQANILSNLTFHGELSPADTNAIIKNSRILIGTSDYEGSPNAYIFASLYGTPILSLNVACQGVCVQGNYESMKRELEKIMSNNTYANLLSEQELAYARANYDMKLVIQKWISLIQETYYSQTY
ncbi:MAG TPA: glycosyltransferase family 4 protein [Candidatus Andersenbacteria bacterium]|nr:glycosyltransferase family 4 protein [Candidatus Andersenbacteria bacterium]